MPSLALRRRRERVLGLALAVQLTVGVVSAVVLRPAPEAPARSSSAPVLAANARNGVSVRTLAVRQLLATRAAAVLHKDKDAFLATVDPGARAFQARQGALFDALGVVPLATWRYDLDPTRERRHTAALDALRGVWWSPNVTLHYALTGFDRSPTVQPQGLTFVERGGRWYLGAEDDFARMGHPTSRDLWDGGPVVLARGASCLVLGHPKNAALVRQLVVECDAAVPRATAVWGRGWGRRVVLLVPDSEKELASIVPDSGDLSQIAALATAELVSPGAGYHPVGDRVLINPSNFRSLGALGRRVVLAHEITHVASRASTGPQVPTWFVEGLADYVGYLGVDLPLSLSAEELRADVRGGKLPTRLPLDGDFDGSRKDLAQTYEMSWLAVVWMAKTYGQSTVLQVYREAGADSRPGALGRAVRHHLHLTVPEVTRAWRAYLVSVLT
ncbi:MAG: hypothetical protein JWO12_444 [Frankiales bacterium]|nr:hypothetical protein [Frankiales bacterium]